MNDYQICLSKVNFISDSEKTFIDVGCNINDNLDNFTEIFLSLYPESKCIAIEPIFWQEYEKKYFNDKRITLVKKALSDKQEFKQLNIPQVGNSVNSGLSSLYQREVFNKQFTKTLVECTSMDILFSELNLKFIDYLKIDTEGAELDILRGCAELLTNKK